MNGAERREQILDMLQNSDVPLSGSAIAKKLGVSRQVIVQDMALLRTRSDVKILSTYQGYLICQEDRRCQRVFKVRHSQEETEEELQIIVDLGGRVEDVFVSHSVYGIVRGQLNLASRRDIEAFMERLKASRSTPLMQITDDYHYHTVVADDKSTLDQIQAKLQARGFLAPLLDYEPKELF